MERIPMTMDTLMWEVVLGVERTKTSKRKEIRAERR